MKKSSTEGVLKGITQKDKVYVGLDVHKRNIEATVRVNGVERTPLSMPANPDTVVRFLEKYRLGLKKVVYEAGPTGYGLARRLRKEGMPVEVIAPGKTPKMAQEGAKSDRLDSRKLAEYAEKGLLKAVAIPTEEEEGHRQLVRLRNSIVEKRRRVKQQIKSFLLQHGLKEPKGLGRWNLYAIHGLKEIEMSKPLRYTLDSYIRELLYWVDELQKVNKELKALMNAEGYEKKARILKSHPGVGEVTAVQMLTEVYQPQRFKNAKQVTAYVGLSPKVRQSGENRKEGPLVKAGRETLRAALVESAWAWVRVEKKAARTYGRLMRNTGSCKKAIVAMARKLLVHLWVMLVRQEPYRATA